MENKNIWKKAEQSFVYAYDLALGVLNGKLSVTIAEKKRLNELLSLWIEALAGMLEHASDTEMTKDFQDYQKKLKSVQQKLKKNVYDNI